MLNVKFCTMLYGIIFSVNMGFIKQDLQCSNVWYIAVFPGINTISSNVFRERPHFQAEL